VVASRDILEIMGTNKYEQVGFREILQIPRKVWEKIGRYSEDVALGCT